MKQDTHPRKTTRRVTFGSVATAIFVAIGLAACGSTNNATSTTTVASGTGASSTGANAASGGSQSVVVSTAQNAKFGTILESGGKTLYTLAPSSTPCTTACLKIWPSLSLPQSITKATAGSGVTASNLGTVDQGGTLQVTYSGKALYFFSGDTTAGQANGNITDTWGKWSVIVTAAPADSGSSASTPTTMAPGSGGAGF
jgi:predicted lipoprotein with Yx(FWY)xxD motif